LRAAAGSVNRFAYRIGDGWLRPPEGRPKLIEIEELTKYYGERKGVGPLSFRIETGQVVGLLGLNGAGKTTTLRMLASDLLPTSGQIRVDGVDLVEAPEKVRPKIGCLPDRPPLYDEMQVREYLAFVARLRGVPASRIGRRVDEAIETTELGRESSTRIGALSHGFRQRVGIAQAVVHQPTLLLLDEPIAGLDPVQIVEMRRMIRSLRGQHTIVLSSHILTEIRETCDELLVIQDGEIIASGSEEALLQRMADASEKVAATTTVVMTVRVPAALWVPAEHGPLRDLVLGLGRVKSVQMLPAEEPGERIATMRVGADGDVREPVCAALVQAGVGLLRVAGAIEERELEDVFLQLTRAARASDRAAQPAAEEGA